MGTLKVITIPSTLIPRRFRSYQHHVLRRGHIPGVLSGTELSGKARDYSDRYASSRESVREFVAAYGVKDAIFRRLPGCPRVWVDARTGERVKIVIEYD